MGRDELIFVGSVVIAGTVLATDRQLPLGLAVAAAGFVLIWIASLVVRDAGIVDICWGPAIAGLGWFYHVREPEPSRIGLLACVLATLWGLRLAAHIATRNRGRGEDPRYRRWREQAGASFWWVSLFKVFLLQAVVAWIVSSPLRLAQGEAEGPIAVALVVAGSVVWLIGFLFEAVADGQLLAFKRDPRNRGQVLGSGLWALSRHPNYFGEALLWWGLGLIAVPAGGVLAVVGPAVLTFTLLRISGVAMLDRDLGSRRPGYARYMADTPSFLPIPRWLRRRRPDDGGASA